ncbi:hypothetical protein [Oceanithermus profundus]
MRKVLIMVALLVSLASAFTVEEEVAPTAVVDLMRAQLASTVELLSQDGVWLGWDAATARVTYYPLATQVAYDVYVPNYLMDNVYLVATVWGDKVYDARLVLRLGNGQEIGWWFDTIGKSESFGVVSYPVSGRLNPIGIGEVETIFATLFPKTYARLIRGKAMASY